MVIEGSYLLATTYAPDHWERFMLEGWKIRRRRRFTDHIEISFSLFQNDTESFEHFVNHPIVMLLHHWDVKNDL